ncbi:MAG: hypothetical protein AB8E15_04970 [Bdellovibrionales bacterium]
MALLASCGNSILLPSTTGKQSCVQQRSGVNYHTGSGTTESPFLICSVTDFTNLISNSSDHDKNFKLGQNLNLTDVNISPIGSYDWNNSSAAPFRGVFDGNGKTLSNLKVDTSSTDYSAALFGATNGATIKNLSITNAQITTTSYGAILIGNATNTDLSNISISGSVSCATGSGVRCAGAVANTLIDDELVTMTDLTVDSTVTGHDLIGGVFGYYELNGASGVISSIEHNGSVTATPGAGNTFGGVISYLKMTNSGNINIRDIDSSSTTSLVNKGSFSGNFFGTIVAVDSSPSEIRVSNCHGSGNLTTPANFNAGFIGGFAGIINATSPASLVIEKSSYVGNVTISPGGTNRRYIGLFAGHVTGGVTIENSFTKGNLDIQSSGGRDTGLFIGSVTNGVIVSNNYVSGTLSGVSLGANIGGFVGSDAGGIYQTNYWDSTHYITNSNGIGSTSTPSNVEAKTNSQLKQSATFSSWDFDEVWQINENISLPVLR